MIREKICRNSVLSGIIFTTMFLIWGMHSFCVECFGDTSVSESAKTIEVTASVDKDSVTIGEKIKFTITIESEKNTEFESPNFGENLSEFTIKDFGSQEKTLWKVKKYIQWYVLDTYVTGEYTIPAVTVKYREKGETEWKGASTEEIKVNVKSVIEDSSQTSDIKDVKPPQKMPGRRFLLAVVIGLSTLLAVTVLWTVSAIKRKMFKYVPQKLSHEIAYERLLILKSKELIKDNRIEEYYVELSDIVRHYIEDRFNLNAPEMTTEEFLVTVKDSGKLTPEQKNLLKEFLVHCDLVKFAKYGPDSAEATSSMESAEKLIEQTKEEQNV